jgi:hypothetical protein
MQLSRVGLLAVVALVAVACGGDGDGGDSDGVAAPAAASSSATTATSAATAPSTTVEVPDAVLTDVASGEEVSLRSMVPSERPVLFWFWAPH